MVAVHAKWRREPNKHKDSDAFPQWNTNVLLFSQSWLCNKSITFFNDLYKAREIHIYARKKHKLSHSNASKTQQTCGYRHMRKVCGFFNDTARASTLAVNFGSFAKVSVPVRSIMPCLVTYMSGQDLTLHQAPPSSEIL